MPLQHTTRPGDSLLGLAYAHGFPTWRTIWNDDANASLRESRSDPQVLAPGDVVAIPDRVSDPGETCPVDKSHRFRLTRPRAWVNLRMLDNHGETLAGLRYALRIGDIVHDGTVDDDGLISVEIRPTEEFGVLTVWLDEPDTTFQARVRIGHLDPASTLAGARGRLRNLGADCADTSTTHVALASFQCATAQNDASGDLDEHTIDALRAAHDQGAS